jgi:hypothetical protein
LFYEGAKFLKYRRFYKNSIEQTRAPENQGVIKNQKLESTLSFRTLMWWQCTDRCTQIADTGAV